MATYYGIVGIRYGADAASTSFGSALMQGYNLTEDGEETLAKNSTGNTVGAYGTDPKKGATFTMLVANSTANSVSASVTKPSYYNKITVTSAVSGSNIVGTNWIVKKTDENARNDGFTELVVNTTAYELIT